MQRRTQALIVCFSIIVIPPTLLIGGVVYSHHLIDNQLKAAIAAATAKYKATITRKDSHKNTTTFTDYCDAKSISEAETIFKQRYSDATISGVSLDK